MLLAVLEEDYMECELLLAVLEEDYMECELLLAFLKRLYGVWMITISSSSSISILLGWNDCY